MSSSNSYMRVAIGDVMQMSKIGFDPNTIRWFASYLSRTQIVRYNNIDSPMLNVKTGIGQGTILGPLIFIFYINDLISVTNTLKVNMYADDCILYSSGNDWNRMVHTFQPELDNIHLWCSENRLKLNVNKSKTLLIGSRSKLGKVDYANTLKIAGNVLSFVDKYKYLGTIIDKEMSLSYLLTDVKKSVLSKLFTLRKIRMYITEKCALSIYKQAILPFFDYVGFMLISCNKSDRSDLQVIQNDALRTCFNIRRRDRLSIAKMHAKSNLLSLEQRRRLQLLSLMYLHKDNTDNLRNRVRLTREADRVAFQVEIYQNCKYKNSPYYKGANLWKSIPLELTRSPCRLHFKNELKKLYKACSDEL